jgi:hypothetical protein
MSARTHTLQENHIHFFFFFFITGVLGHHVKRPFHTGQIKPMCLPSGVAPMNCLHLLTYMTYHQRTQSLKTPLILYVSLMIKR